MTNPDELKPCRECGAPCILQEFSGQSLQGTTTLWVCSKDTMFGGDCSDGTAYLSEAAWNDRPMTDKECLELVEKVAFAWTATEGYKHFPPYVNLTGNRLVVRGQEEFNGEYYEHGQRVEVELPDEAITELRETLAATPLVKLREALEAVRKVSSDAPELNMFNYDEEDVARLNEAMIDVHHIVHDAALSSNLEGG